VSAKAVGYSLYLLFRYRFTKDAAAIPHAKPEPINLQILKEEIHFFSVKVAFCFGSIVWVALLHDK
jgi:hypothetical protein